MSFGMVSSYPCYIPSFLHVSVILCSRCHIQLLEENFTKTQGLEWLCGQTHLGNTQQYTTYIIVQPSVLK